MAVNIITKFVLGQFAKRSARNTGIASLKKASDSVVKSNAKNIEIILKNMGVDINNLKSTDDVLKHMNIHKAMMNQSLKQGFKGLDLDKGIKSLEKTKKPWHQGWDPKIVKTKPEDKKIPMFERHQKEIKDIDTKSEGMGFYSEMSDLMERQRLEELELDYDTMFNKILEKAKRIDADPKVLLEAELGKKITGKETTTQLLDIFKNRPKKASGGRVPLMYGGDPGFAFEYGGSWADWHDQHRDQMPVEQYIKTKLPKHRLPFRELQSGGLAYMLGEPTYMKYGAGGSVGHAPWLKPSGQPQPQGQNETPTPNVATRPDPMKAPRGLPSLAPKNMDPAYMQQQMMQTAMMGQGPRTMANEGGRIGFDKGKKVDLSKRRFLKGAGAGIGLLSMLPFVGKFFKAAKLAKPAAAVTETIIKSNAPGMPAWFPPLVKRVLKEGEDVSKAAGAMERQTVHRATLPSGTPVEVTSDLTKGDVIVDIGMGKHGWKDGWHGQPTRLVLKKGEWIEPTKKGKKGIKTKDEFDIEEAEFTGGHPENIKYEDVTIEQYGNHGSDFTEVEKYATGKTTKGSKAKREVWEPDWDDSLPDYEDYASGGLAGLLGE